MPAEPACYLPAHFKPEARCYWEGCAVKDGNVRLWHAGPLHGLFCDQHYRSACIEAANIRARLTAEQAELDKARAEVVSAAKGWNAGDSDGENRLEEAVNALLTLEAKNGGWESRRA